MEKDKMLQILIPTLAVAAVIVVVVLIVGGPSADSEPTKRGSGHAPPVPAGMKIVAEVPASIDGLTLEKPDTSGPEWRDIGDGLKVWEVKVGEGDATITTADTGNWHYTGWRPDAFIFDSSVRRNEPIDFRLTEVIVGWTRGLAGMKVGGIRRLYIPSPLAYGNQAKGKDIPANTDLIFEVKLNRISRPSTTP
jgi:hypothetical protein